MFGRSLFFKHHSRYPLSLKTHFGIVYIRSKYEISSTLCLAIESCDRECSYGGDDEEEEFCRFQEAKRAKEENRKEVTRLATQRGIVEALSGISTTIKKEPLV